jgi:hypothetical protein
LLASSRYAFLALLLSGLLAATACGRASPGEEAVSQSRGEIDIDVPDEVVDVPGDVHEVRSLGAWRDGNRAGTYRVVTLRGGVDHIRTVVIVQWMEQAFGQGMPSVVAARRVELLDDLGPITVPSIRQRPSPDGLTVSIQVRNIVSGEEGAVEAVAGPPGQLTAEYTATGKR